MQPLEGMYFGDLMQAAAGMFCTSCEADALVGFLGNSSVGATGSRPRLPRWHADATTAAAAIGHVEANCQRQVLAPVVESHAQVLNQTA